MRAYPDKLQSTLQHWGRNEHGTQDTGGAADNGLLISKLIIMLFRDGINHILFGISINPMAVLVQFNGRLLISVVGSKIEDKFLFIFSLFC